MCNISTNYLIIFFNHSFIVCHKPTKNVKILGIIKTALHRKRQPKDDGMSTTQFLQAYKLKTNILSKADTKKVPSEMCISVTHFFVRGRHNKT